MDLTRFVEAAERLHVLGIKVTKDDELIGEWYYEPECRRKVYSATKSFTSCAVGFAVQEGLLSLDEKLTDAEIQERYRAIAESEWEKLKTVDQDFPNAMETKWQRMKTMCGRHT